MTSSPGRTSAARYYKFLEERWALDDIENRRLRVSELHGLNDPFEFVPFDLSDIRFREGLFRARDQLCRRGMISFSREWSNLLLWAHYADKHRGICLGFDVQLARSRVRKIRYVPQRLPAPRMLQPSVATNWLFTKGSDWQYEKEVRVFASRDVSENGHYYAKFRPNGLILREVILGYRCPVERGQVIGMLAGYRQRITVIRAQPAFDSFRVVAVDSCTNR